MLIITTLYKHPLAKLDLALERIQGSKKITGLLAAYIAKKRQRELDEAAARRREAEQAERIAQTMKDKAAVSGTIDDELAAQQAVETADQVAAAAAKPRARTRVKGDLSTRATSLREYWSAKIVDWKLARKHYRTECQVVKAYDDAVQMVANDDATQLKDPPRRRPASSSTSGSRRNEGPMHPLQKGSSSRCTPARTCAAMTVGAPTCGDTKRAIVSTPKQQPAKEQNDGRPTARPTRG